MSQIHPSRYLKVKHSKIRNKDIWGMPSLLFTGMDIEWVEMGEERRAIVTVVQCSGVFLVPSASICVHCGRLIMKLLRSGALRAVILLIEALFRVTSGANLPFAARTYS